MKPKIAKIPPKYQKQLKKLKVGIVYLYGSHVTGTNHPLSDVDIGVVFADKKMAQEAKKRSIRLGAEFDLLFEEMLNVKNVQTTFLQATPLVLQQNAIEGKVLYEANPVFRADYEEYVTLRYADFAPLLEQFYKDRLNVKYV